MLTFEALPDVIVEEVLCYILGCDFANASRVSRNLRCHALQILKRQIPNCDGKKFGDLVRLRDRLHYNDRMLRAMQTWHDASVPGWIVQTIRDLQSPEIDARFFEYLSILKEGSYVSKKCSEKVLIRASATKIQAYMPYLVDLAMQDVALRPFLYRIILRGCVFEN